MNYRLVTLHELESYSVDTTEIIGIKVTEPISNLVIQLSPTAQGEVMTAHPIACLEKIELIDGSDVLFSLSGYEAQAVDIYHNKGIVRSPYVRGMAGSGGDHFVGINFGRYLWDPELAFDPKKFTNPQLKIKLDIDGGGNTPTGNDLKVWASVFDEKAITPIGFLMHKEIKDYALAASAHEYTNLPTDHPYRKLFLRAARPGTEPGQIISNVKLSEDMDKRVPYNHSAGSILRVIAMTFPEVVEHWFKSFGNTQDNIFCIPSTRVSAFGNPWRETVSGQNVACFFDGDGGRLRCIADATTDFQVFIRGYLPHCTWEIPFGMPDVIEDWYDVAKVESLRLDVTAGADALATDSAQIFLQQLRRY